MTGKMENMLAVYITITLFAYFVSCVYAFSYPWHASCKIDWKFSTDCQTVEGSLEQVISNWKGDENCQHGGQRCLYQLLSKSSSVLKATHETPVKHYKDDLTFNFASTQNGGCTVQGFSTSETWYAVLDYGTNYCNLHNLIVGADLDKGSGYQETTSDSICTQYSSANCDKY